MATVLDAPVSIPGLWPFAEPAPLRAVLGVADVAETAARLALVVGLRMLAADPRMVRLGCPLDAAPVLVLAGRAVRAEDAPVLCRLTFALDSRADLNRAVAVARHHGATPLRALRDGDEVEAHVTGPCGMELGFVYRGGPRDLGADGTPLAFSPGRLGGRPSDLEGRIRLDHVVLGAAGADGREVLRTTDGRAYGTLQRRDELCSTVSLLSVG